MTNPSPESILALLCSKDKNQKILCLQHLSKNPDDLNNREVLEQVHKLATDADIGVKFWAKKILAKLPESAAALLEFQAPPASGTEVVPEGLTLEELFEKLKTDEVQANTGFALEVLRRIFALKDETCIEPLQSHLAVCPDVWQLSFIVKYIGITFPREEMLPLIGKFLKHPDERTVANAIEGIEAINSPKSVVLYSQMLEHPSHRVKANATKALAKVDPEKSAAIFQQMLGMKERPNFIIAACHAIKALKASQFIPDLRDLLSQEFVQEDAIDALFGIGSESALSVLESFAFTQNENTLREKILAKVEKARPKKMETSLFKELEESLEAPRKSAAAPPSVTGQPKGIPRWARMVFGLGAALLVLAGAFFRFAPNSQAKFLEIVIATQKRAKADADKALLLEWRRERQEKCFEALGHQRGFTQWSGVVETCDSANQGERAVFSVHLEEPAWFSSHPPLTNIYIRTRNNRYSDVSDHTLISRDSPLYKELIKMKKGDRVLVSGEFLPDEKERIRIGNANEGETLRIPHFIVKFTGVRKR